ncbi:MAG: glycine cleavage system aminomethyltransferase GcvT [Pseudomonadota bacterium]|nr:glycine cleavage system aminomethyltransferase GcvT [Pseudomonadota bacterium]
MSAELRTPLYDLHLARGARMVPFAGYQMPVQYPGGILAESLHTRSQASLFDVSHMGQLDVVGEGCDEELETLLASDLISLQQGQQRYSVLTNARGGVLDDLMVARAPNGFELHLVVNASRKHADLAHLRDGLAGRAEVRLRDDLALLALQGPAARAVLGRLNARVAELRFLQQDIFTLAGAPCRVSCSGYTGEDGFEISVRAADVPALAERLLAEPEVALAGLGARDALRLEAGMCLYGHDLTEDTSPVEAGVVFAVAPARRAKGARPGGFPGAERILGEIARGPERLRVGLLPEERTPLREGVRLFDESGESVGEICSGGFSPTLNRPIAMAYVRRAWGIKGARLFGEVRGRRLAASVVSLPFVPARVLRPA